MIDLELILLVGAVVVIVAIVAARIGTRIGLPALLLFLGLGMVIGETAWASPSTTPDLAHALGFGALVSSSPRAVSPPSGPTSVRGRAGAGAGHGRDRGQRRADDAVRALRARARPVAGDPARRRHLSDGRGRGVLGAAQRADPARLRGVLEAESGLNDAPTVLLVSLASAAALTGPAEHGRIALGGLIVLELAAGLAIGIALGWLGVPDPAPGGAAVLRPLPAGDPGLDRLRVRVWPTSPTPAGSPRSTSAR